MLILKSLKLNNFLSHQATTLNFIPNSRFSIDGISGGGKSSILEAVLWVLFGRGRIENRSLISNGATSASVELKLEDGDKIFVITRSITKAGKHLLEAGEESADGQFQAKCAGVKQSQDWIEKDLLHASYQLFTNSVAYPQNNDDTFVKQTATKRKDLLLEIASVEDFEEYYDRAKERLQSTEVSIERLTGEMAGLVNKWDEKTEREKLEQAKKEKITLEAERTIQATFTLDAKRKLSDMEAEVRVEQEKFAAVNREAAQAQAGVTSLSADLESKKARLSALTVRLAEKPDGTIVDLMEKIAEIDKAIQAETALQNTYAIEKEKLNSLIKSAPVDSGLEIDLTFNRQKLADMIASFQNFCTLGDACRNHKNALNASTKFIDERIDEIEKRMVEHQKRVKEHADAVTLASRALPIEPPKDALNVLLGNKNIYNAHIRAINSFADAEKELSQVEIFIKEKTVTLEEKIFLLSDLSVQLRGLESKVRAFDLEPLRRTIKEFETTFDTLNEKVISLSSVIATQEFILGKIAQSSVRQHEIELETIVLRRNSEALALIKDAFGSKGIKAVAVDVLIPQLEKSINDVLSQLSDFRITLDTQKSSVDGESQLEGLFINVHNPQGQTMDFNAFSGGEKIKITIAIAEALAGLQKVGFRLMDEAIVGLDEDSVLSFTEAMQKIQTKFPQMLVISHIPQIKELFEDRIEVVKKDGISMVI